MIIVDDIAQGTEAWAKLRNGVITASNFGKIITPSGHASAQAQNYVYKLAAETVTGETEEQWQSEAMRQGVINEAEVRDVINFAMDVQAFREVGFIFKDSYRKVGCSPDGLSEKIGLEIKCPLAATHMEYLHNGVLPTKYIPQVQGCMWVTGISRWMFVSYRSGMRPLIIEVKADQKYIDRLEAEVYKAVELLDKIVDNYLNIRGL